MSHPTAHALFSETGVAVRESWGNAEVQSATADSRTVQAGALFVCMPSENRDSHQFIEQAVSSGAVAVLAHSQEGFQRAVGFGVASAWIDPKQPDFNVSVAAIVKLAYGDPSAKMRMIGVTGTNGKTTTAWMIRDALVEMGRKATYLGTLGIDVLGDHRELANTTPFPAEMWSLLAEAADAGSEDFCMEVSSHSLQERRVAGLDFDIGVFTNLTQDHLDYHGDMGSYAEAKRLMFAEHQATGFRSAINIGDEFGRSLREDFGATVTFGLDDADLVAEPLEVLADRLRLKASFGGDEESFGVPVGGLFNVWNATAALAALLAMGESLSRSTYALGQVSPVPGRFEAVQSEFGFSVIVDYAHTDDAMKSLLLSVQGLEHKRVITVFGCGGDRDRAKRPKVAAVASELSDITIVTSDNPRTEDPAQIIRDIEQGLLAGKPTQSIIDRKEAIAVAVREAQPGDIVVIAGKGHEDYQIVGREKLPMDDRVLARKALEERGP
ncbi:MAG: UDP-N-acetylmuramoyl-L-alanyl-D-glutamate--2,6-diaminopimelate ligase [Armatimonadetes bacterium]|nr:UDP-N-acetylmuramoyl-L-alanyl-D-glutamate--2,6-diaminopimelate ligase [Armatimonadota bacterium]